MAKAYRLDVVREKRFQDEIKKLTEPLEPQTKRWTAVLLKTRMLARIQRP
jgi:hypothetical protein